MIRQFSNYYEILDVKKELDGIKKKLTTTLTISQLQQKQLKFYNEFEIPTRQVVIYLNKYDLAPEKLKNYQEKVSSYFIDERKKLVKDIFPTVALKGAGEEYEEYQQNCLQGILSLCEFDRDASAFDVWEGQ